MLTKRLILVAVASLSGCSSANKSPQSKSAYWPVWPAKLVIEDSTYVLSEKASKRLSAILRRPAQVVYLESPRGGPLAFLEIHEHRYGLYADSLCIANLEHIVEWRDPVLREMTKRIFGTGDDGKRRLDISAGLSVLETEK